MGKFQKFIDALVFPPACRMCGKLQSPFAKRAPQVLCSDCAARWQSARAEICGECHAPQDQCRCMPSRVAAHGARLYHLVAYRPGERAATNQLILRCKENCDRPLFRFLAKELAQLHTPDAETLISFVPRRLSAVRAIGHDHAHELARAFAACNGTHERVLLARNPNATVEQKTLSAAERAANAADSYLPLPNTANEVRGKTVFLIDDVCTTGSSLSSCVAILQEAGAERVICAVIAKTERE